MEALHSESFTLGMGAGCNFAAFKLCTLFYVKARIDDCKINKQIYLLIEVVSNKLILYLQKS